MDLDLAMQLLGFNPFVMRPPEGREVNELRRRIKRAIRYQHEAIACSQDSITHALGELTRLEAVAAALAPDAPENVAPSP